MFANHEKILGEAVLVYSTGSSAVIAQSSSGIENIVTVNDLVLQTLKDFKVDELSSDEWACLLALSNVLDENSLKLNGKAYLSRFQESLGLLSDIKPAVDGRLLFEEKVFLSHPRHLAFFIGGPGEMVVDLLYVMTQAKRYQQYTATNREWQISLVIDFALGAFIHQKIAEQLLELVAQEPLLADLHAFIQQGKVEVIWQDAEKEDQGTLSRFLQDLSLKKGTILVKGLKDIQYLKSFSARRLHFLTTKSREDAVETGTQINDLVVAYKPRSFRGRLTADQETMRSVTLYHALKYLFRFVRGYSRRGDGREKKIIPPEETWLYLLPLVLYLKEKREIAYPIFLERGSLLLIKPWKTLIAYLKKLDIIDFHGEYATQRISSYKKAGDLSRMINTILSSSETRQEIIGARWRGVWSAYQSLSADQQKIIEEHLRKVTGDMQMTFKGLEGKSVGEIVSLIAEAGMDQRYQRFSFKQSLSKKRWDANAEDIKRIQEQDPSLAEQISLLISYRKESSVKFLAKIKEVFTKYDAQVATDMRRNTQHVARPILNILLSGTKFSQLLRSRQVVFIDEALAGGATVITCELIAKSFDGNNEFQFAAIDAWDATRSPRSIVDILVTSDSMIEEDAPEKLGVFAYVTEKISNIERYKQINIEGMIQDLSRAYTTSRGHLADERLEDALDKDYFSQKKLREVNAKIQSFVHAHLKDLFSEDYNEKVLVALVKHYLRKHDVSKVYFEEYMAPRGWEYLLAEEFKAKNEQAYNILRSLDQQEDLGLEDVRQLDSEVASYDMLKVLLSWKLEEEAYQARQVKGIERLVQDTKLRTLTSLYLQGPESMGEAARLHEQNQRISKIYPQFLHSRFKTKIAIFDWDGTLSRIREGWEWILSPLVAAIISGAQCPMTFWDEVVRAVLNDERRYDATRLDGVEDLIKKGILRQEDMEWAYQIVERTKGFTNREQILLAYDEAMARNIKIENFQWVLDYCQDKSGAAPPSAAEALVIFFLDLVYRLRNDRLATLKETNLSPAKYLFPKTTAFLSRLQDENVVCYIVTGSDKRGVEEEVALLGLRPQVKDIVGFSLEGGKGESKEEIMQALVNQAIKERVIGHTQEVLVVG
ncbi:MAG TPA: HAD family hydrolase, partial [Candidatus Omnitrophota bacterium]|nr:HAD family hydrolase [Candidatus Omnitrophota bacterium]